MGSWVVLKALDALEHLDLETPIRRICARQRQDLNWGVILLGKNAADMMNGVAFPHFRGIVVGPVHALPRRAPRPWTVLPGDHPVPGRNSFRAGAEICAFAKDPRFDAFFVGISGGGSALAEHPLKPFFTQNDVREANRSLLASDLSVREINAVRKRLSSLKGGRLAAGMGLRTAVTVLLSDVPSNQAGTIASGPTVPDDTTHDDVAHALGKLPPSGWKSKIAGYLQFRTLPGTLKPGDPVFDNKKHSILTDNAFFLETIRKGLKPRFKRVRVLLANADGSLTTVLPKLWSAVRALRPQEALLFGGEFTFTLPEAHGSGGRVSHLGLVLLDRLLHASRHTEFGAFGLATDGVDGSGPGSGFYFEAPTVAPEAVRGALSRFDSGTFFAERGMGLARPARTFNLRDIFVVWRNG
jgi:hydroxypyruvate reductase